MTADNQEAPAAGAPATFRDGGAVANATTALQMSDVHRVEADLKSAITVAKTFPRDLVAFAQALRESCSRPGFAEDAEYKFPRGGKDVTGPSIYFAREAARLFGNIRHGVNLVARSEGQIHLRAWAHDVQTNTKVEADAMFSPLVQRKNKSTGVTEWREADERDLRELIGRHGAIATRNCLMQLLPCDIVDEMIAVARETSRKKASGDLKKDRSATIRTLVDAFAKLAVSQAMLEAYLDHKLEAVSDDELAELRKVHKSMADGNSKREDHFAVRTAAPAGKIEDLLGRPPETPPFEALRNETAAEREERLKF